MLEEPEEEGVLTAERVLRHAQAQGLQPVVDVRFSHRHLELCRRQGQEIPVRGCAGDPAPCPREQLRGGKCPFGWVSPTPGKTHPHPKAVVIGFGTSLSDATTSGKGSLPKSSFSPHIC